MSWACLNHDKHTYVGGHALTCEQPLHCQCGAMQEFDGACRGNPGVAGAGARLVDDHSGRVVGCQASRDPERAVGRCRTTRPTTCKECVRCARMRTPRARALAAVFPMRLSPAPPSPPPRPWDRQIFEVWKYLGPDRTNNEAEHEALICALIAGGPAGQGGGTALIYVHAVVLGSD